LKSQLKDGQWKKQIEQFQMVSNASLFNDVLKLKDHPTLTLERPYVLFKIERVDDCTGIFGMAENNDINAIQTTSNDQRTVDTNLTVDQTSLLIEASNFINKINKCIISPNPSENMVNINCDRPWLSIELLDGLSRKLPCPSISASGIDLSNLSKGQYYLRITFDNVVETFKVIKL
jgi:hypothetical protein